jgi:transposase
MQLGLDPKKLVFLDETGAKTNMTRLCGRAPIGQRLVDRTPHGHWVNNTYVCGLRYNRIVAPHVFVGAMNAVRFLHYIETILLPTLRKGDVVVMDNLSAHLDGRVVPLIESKGVSVLYLPGYSPDLNPIELSFSKLKSMLRKLKIRDVPTLQQFLLDSGSQFTKKECQAYFKHIGYTVHKR